MINLETVKTLRVLRLPGMARELESQLEDPQRYKGLSFAAKRNSVNLRRAWKQSSITKTGGLIKG